MKLWNSVRMFLWMTLMTGVLYPLLITAIAQLTMQRQADGSFLMNRDKIMGSELIAQKFEGNKYFWARPSFNDYNPLFSGGSNLAPTSKALKQIVAKRQERIAEAHNVMKNQVPVELLFASGSGLDPHINVQTAYFQMERVAKSRGIANKEVEKLIDKMIIHHKLDFVGENYINVLLLNKVLDESYAYPGLRR